VRPDFQDAERIVYLLVVPAAPKENLPQEYFVVVGAPSGPNEIVFVTAFPAPHSYWVSCRRGGRRLYPPPEPTGKPRKKKRQ
jgi:hypothetical protein